MIRTNSYSINFFVFENRTENNISKKQQYYTKPSKGPKIHVIEKSDGSDKKSFICKTFTAGLK